MPVKRLYYARSNSTFAATWTVNSVGPITMGLVAKEGQIPSGFGVRVGSFTTQTDILNIWTDGSLRYALVSFNATSTGAKTLTVIVNSGGTYTPTWPSGSVAINVSGTVYTAAFPAFDATNTVCNGDVCRRAWVMRTPTTSGAVNHVSIRVLIEITSYAIGGHRVAIGIQNIIDNSSNTKVLADVTTTVNGSDFADLTKAGWTIFTGTMHLRVAYVSMTEAEVLHDFEPWIEAHVVPRFVGADPHTYDLTTAAYGLEADFVGSNRVGEAEYEMADSESNTRQELNPWCDWEARLFCLNTEAYRQAVIRNAYASGEWTYAVSKTDDVSIWKVTDVEALSMLYTNGLGLQWPAGGGVGHWWTGDTGGSLTSVAREHYPEMVFVAYLLTGDTFLLNMLRFQAAWASMASFDANSPLGEEPLPGMWANFRMGRKGSLGLATDAGFQRAFGRCFKKFARTAWALPDGHSDQEYFKTLTQNNLNEVGDYIDYLDEKGWTGTWAPNVGFRPGWHVTRGNDVSNTTGASPTVLTVIGDDSGVGSGTNDHGMQTGDYTILTGFSGGASGLNGRHVITRLTATTFSVAVNTIGSATTGQGTWSTITGWTNSPWQLCDGVADFSWACFTGLFTTTDSIWAFPDRAALMMVAYQDNPAFDTYPSLSYNYYPSSGKTRADQYVAFESWTEFEAANNTTTGDLIDSEAGYDAIGSASHRGMTTWDGSIGANRYLVHAVTMLAHGKRRGLIGCSAAYTRLLAANSGQATTEAMNRPGFYLGVP